MKKTIKQHTKRKLVYGIGINDADYAVTPIVDGKQKMCPYYRKWHDMLKRCYSDSYQSRKPTYIGCTVSEEWHSFMNFKSWMEKQDWKDKQLDKDILKPDNKIYSADNCIFVNSAINKLFNDSKATRGDFPQGVNYHKSSKKYRAEIRINGKKKHLGLFGTVPDAEQAYLTAKIIYVKQHIKDNKHNPRLVSGLNKHLKLIENKIGGKTDG